MSARRRACPTFISAFACSKSFDVGGVVGGSAGASLSSSSVCSSVQPFAATASAY